MIMQSDNFRANHTKLHISKQLVRILYIFSLGALPIVRSCKKKNNINLRRKSTAKNTLAVSRLEMTSCRHYGNSSSSIN